VALIDEHCCDGLSITLTVVELNLLVDQTAHIFQMAPCEDALNVESLGLLGRQLDVF
jgi:hypothetical protein